MPKGMTNSTRSLPRAQEIVDAGIERFRRLYTEMAKRTSTPPELRVCMESVIYDAMEQLYTKMSNKTAE